MSATLLTRSSKQWAARPSDECSFASAIAHDRLGFAAGDTNLYRYCGNDPTEKMDPSGLADIVIGQPNGPPLTVPSKPTPTPGPNTPNEKYFFEGYFIESFATPKNARLRQIPGVVTPAANPTNATGPAGGSCQIYPSPASPPAPIGGGGSQTCIILVVKGSGYVAVFHFSVGDNPYATLARFSWPNCSSIIAGGDNTGQSNCLADDVLAAAKSHGLNVEGVSGNSSCGVDANGNWYQWGK